MRFSGSCPAEALVSCLPRHNREHKSPSKILWSYNNLGWEGPSIQPCSIRGQGGLLRAFSGWVVNIFCRWRLRNLIRELIPKFGYPHWAEFFLVSAWNISWCITCPLLAMHPKEDFGWRNGKISRKPSQVPDSLGLQLEEEWAVL